MTITKLCLRNPCHCSGVSRHKRLSLPLRTRQEFLACVARIAVMAVPYTVYCIPYTATIAVVTHPFQVHWILDSWRISLPEKWDGTLSSGLARDWIWWVAQESQKQHWFGDADADTNRCGQATFAVHHPASQGHIRRASDTWAFFCWFDFCMTKLNMDFK